MVNSQHYLYRTSQPRLAYQVGTMVSFPDTRSAELEGSRKERFSSSKNTEGLLRRC